MKNFLELSIAYSIAIPLLIAFCLWAGAVVVTIAVVEFVRKNFRHHWFTPPVSLYEVGGYRIMATTGRAKKWL